MWFKKRREARAEDEHALRLTVLFEETEGGTFQIPACPWRRERWPFDWRIDWGDGSVERVSGVSSPDGGDVQAGSLLHAYGAAGKYDIVIAPAEPVSATVGNDPGWLQAFRYGTLWPFSGKDNLVCVDGILDDCAINIGLEGACAGMFLGCTNITMGSHFTISSKKHRAGDCFCAEMFACCSGDAFNMGEAFQLPRDLREVGKAFCAKMFQHCTGSSFNMHDEFTIPQGITHIDISFCQEMFSGHGPNLTMGRSFNLPQNIAEAEDGFCADMFSFAGAGGEPVFSMNEQFNLPPDIAGYVGNNFCWGMFQLNNGNDFRMSKAFNLPQGITYAGDNFCENMFRGCSGDMFTMNDTFALPPSLREAGINCFRFMFCDCHGEAFRVNPGFDFPIELTGSGFLCYQMFGKCREDSLNQYVWEADRMNPSLRICYPSFEEFNRPLNGEMM